MRVGLVCPYSLDVAGGVQAHVLDLAGVLRARGHDARVLAPVDDATPVPAWVTSSGGAVPVPYNGSVARVGFGPVAALRVRRWLSAGGFDVVHLHEPVTPSVSLLALRAAAAGPAPVVATFHAASLRSRALQAALPLVQPHLDRVTARVAVSEDARRRVVEHLGGDAVVIPNGVHVDRFAGAAPRPAWTGAPGAPVVSFLGRWEEPRKGFAVLAAALPALRAAHPGLRVLVAGHGDARAARAAVGAHADALEVLGPLDEHDKAALLASVDVHAAPQVAGESFGIVLVEAMAAGAPVVASALPAFGRVLDGGAAGALGELVAVGDPAALAAGALRLLADPALRARRSAAASAAVRRYDWARVGHEVMEVYEAVAGRGHSGDGREDPDGALDGPVDRLLDRWRAEAP